MRRRTSAALVTLLCVAAGAARVGVQGVATPRASAAFTTGDSAMAVLSVPVGDSCPESDTMRASALAVWVDDRYDHELLLFPGSRRSVYTTLLGPFAAGQHRVDLRPSAYWAPSACAVPRGIETSVIEQNDARYPLLHGAPVLELRADTVGEQTDLPLYAYAEETGGTSERRLRYTVVFSNEDGGTQTRALFARWGRTTDIEQVYEASLVGGRLVREEFQGPDHETRAFTGRRRGAAPVLLVATLNNMVTDRGRGIASVRPVPEVVDLSQATRESTLDSRPWACRVMGRELAAEGRISADAPPGDRWLRQAPDPRDHVYLEARLTLDRAVVAAWVRARGGPRFSSHYGRESLAIDRNGWVRTAVAVGADPSSNLADVGWMCLQAPGQRPGGSCTIEAVRAFVFTSGWLPGPNLVVPTTLRLRPGEEGTLTRSQSSTSGPGQD